MNVLNLDDRGVYQVFDVSYDSNGYPQFLVYRNGQWLRMSAKHFTPNFFEAGQGGYSTY